MHRNTYIFIIFLAIFAAIVAGVNVSNLLYPQKVVVNEQPQGSTQLAIPSLNSEPRDSTYTSSACGISFLFNSSLSMRSESSESAIFSTPETSDSIFVTCQKDIPRPPIVDNLIEERAIENTSKSISVSAKLYHDQSPKDGSKIDALIFFHPTIQKDVFIAGYGNDFDTIMNSVHLIP